MKAFLVELFKPEAPLLTLMSQGLGGLSDEEYFWEPVNGCWSVRRRSEIVNAGDDTWGDDEWGLDIVYPDPQPSPFTTIAWRMAHMTGSVIVAAAALRGRRLPNGHLDETWPEWRALPTSAQDAVRRWDGAVDLLRDLLSRADDGDLGREETHEWAPWSGPEPVWREVEYFGYFEPASHGAEIRLLRDLYRHTAAGTTPLGRAVTSTMEQGLVWRRMHVQPRRSAASITAKAVPTVPGVYAWYRDGEPVYSGRATGTGGLHGRIWKNHLRTGVDLSRSSFRRNVCEHLGIAPTSKTTVRPTLMTAAQVEPVNMWIRGCEVAWIECESPAEPAALEKELHGEWMPPPSRR